MSKEASHDTPVLDPGLTRVSRNWWVFGRRYETLRYSLVRECPACDGSGEIVEYLTRGTYRFGPVDVPYPEGGRVPILRCRTCGLLYKGIVPDKSDFRRLCAKVSAEVWASHGYDYRHEREFVLRFAKDLPLDILEIGSAEGDLLGSFHELPGRRSALDVVWDSRCCNKVSGEYILQYLEEPLQWSHTPYDVVLAFDIFEHLYSASTALVNLNTLTRPNGLVFIQTGDARRIQFASDLREWWYLNLLEHHLAWTPETLEFAAAHAGFDLEQSEIGPHKDSRYMPAWKRAGIMAFRGLARVPGGAAAALALTSRDPNLIRNPDVSDHFTAVLRRYRD